MCLQNLWPDYFTQLSHSHRWCTTPRLQSLKLSWVKTLAFASLLARALILSNRKSNLVKLCLQWFKRCNVFLTIAENETQDKADKNFTLTGTSHFLEGFLFSIKHCICCTAFIIFFYLFLLCFFSFLSFFDFNSIQKLIEIEYCFKLFLFLILVICTNWIYVKLFKALTLKEFCY